MSFKWGLLLAILVRFNCFYVGKHQHFSGEKIICWCHWDDFCNKKQRYKMSRVLFNEYSLDQRYVFTRCHWFYTTQGSGKYLNSRVLVKWEECKVRTVKEAVFQVIHSWEAEEWGQHRPSGDGEEDWGLAWVGALRGAEHMHQGREAHHLTAQCLSSFSPGVTAAGVSWDSGFFLVTSCVLFTPFYLPLPSKSLVG